jgi:hypothetical protein
MFDITDYDSDDDFTVSSGTGTLRDGIRKQKRKMQANNYE